MNRWVAVAFVLGLVGIFALGLWATRPPEPARAESVAAAAPKLPDVEVAAALAATRPASKLTAKASEETEDEAPAEPVKLDPKSQAFAERVDDVIPSHLYTLAAEHCYNGGYNRDEKIKLSVRIHAANGQIYVTDTKVIQSTITDPGIEACLRDAVAGARWKDHQMPDWEDGDEILIRMRGLKKHLDLDDQDDDDEDEPEGREARSGGSED